MKFCYGNHCTRFCFRNIWYSCLGRNVMHRWNRNFNTPPHRANPGHWTTFCARGERNLMGRPSRGGEFDFCLGGVGWAKLNRSVRFQVIFFFLAMKALTKINTWNICEQLTYKKRSSKVLKYLLRHVWKARSAQISIISDCNHKGRRQLFLWRGNLNDPIFKSSNTWGLLRGICWSFELIGP